MIFSSALGKPATGAGYAVLLWVSAACGTPETTGTVPRWQVAPEPIATIGEADGVTLSQVVGAVWQQERLVVAEASTGSLLYSDVDGSVIGRAGRPGEGPGEFRSLAWLDLWGPDTLVVYDRGRRRVVAFDGQARFVGEWPSDIEDMAFPRPVGTFSDGQILSLADSRAVSSPDEDDRTVRFPLLLARSARDGTLISVVADPIFGSQTYRAPDQGPRIVQLPVIFGYELLVGSGSGMTWWGYSGEPYLHRADATGVLRIALPGESARPVDRDQRAAEIDRMLGAGSAAGRERAAALLADAPANQHFPYFTALLVDHAGRAWVRTADSTPDGARWIVVAPDGEIAGSSFLPPRFTLTHIGKEVLVGIHVDALDVQSVRAYSWSEQD